MKYSCSLCHYSSSRKRDVIRHFDRKVLCGVGEKEVVVNSATFKCEYCDKNFSSSAILLRHQKLYCRGIMQRRIEELEKLASSENKFLDPVENEVNNYGKSSIEKFSDDELKTIRKTINNTEFYLLIPELVPIILLNSEHPENHNIKLTNISDSNTHISVYENGRWKVANKKSVVESVIMEIESIVGEYIGLYGDKYQMTRERFEEYNNRYSDYEEMEETDKEQIRTKKERLLEIEEEKSITIKEIENALYNNRRVIKNRPR